MARRTEPTPPANHASFMRTLFAAEALLNVIGGAAMVLFPTQILQWAKPKADIMSTLKNPSSWAPSPQSAVLLQWLGALVIAMATPLVSALPNAPGALAKRRAAYQSLLVGEVALVAAMVWQFLTSAEMSRAISDKALTLSVGVLCGPLLWRLFCLFVRPGLFGDESTEGRVTSKEA